MIELPLISLGTLTQCFHFWGNFLILRKFDLYTEMFKEADFLRKFLRKFKPLSLDSKMICFEVLTMREYYYLIAGIKEKTMLPWKSTVNSALLFCWPVHFILTNERWGGTKGSYGLHSSVGACCLSTGKRELSFHNFLAVLLPYQAYPWHPIRRVISSHQKISGTLPSQMSEV